ncbi:MAG: type II toxin-antitoxin system HicB family antitoxin [Cyclonatronaceae bacterium]
MKLKVIIHKAEEGGYWAEVPALPGCVSEGDTLDETNANIREAIEGHLEVVQEDYIEVGPEVEIFELPV